MKPLYVKKNGTVNKVSGVAMPNTYPANRVGYDNTTSELESTNTQDAIDEVVENVADKADKVTSPTVGNLAGLNASGNLTDAGWSADKTTSNASGNPISISGLKSNQLAINPVITLEPIQAGSGDPSPSNVRAISGYDKIEVLSTGKNLLKLPMSSVKTNNTDPNGSWSGNTYTLYGVTFTFEVDNDDNVISVTANGQASSAAFVYLTQDANLSILRSDTSYLLNGYVGSSSYSSGISYYWYSHTQSTPYYATSENGVSISNLNSDICIIFRVASGVNANNVKCYPMIRQSSIIDTTFAPYVDGNQIQLQIGQTVYGGTLDVKTGVLTVDRAYHTFNGTETVAEKDIYSRFWINLPSYEPAPTGTSATCISSHYKPSGGTTGMEDMGGSVANIYWENPKRAVYICKNSNISTTADMTTWLTTQYNNGTPLQISYTIENPYTIQLTPHEISLLKDYAYVSTNGTNMQFSYKNGEMASLGDVENLGKTINLLGDKVLTYNNAKEVDLNSLVNNGSYGVLVNNGNMEKQHSPATGYFTLTVVRFDDNPKYVIQYLTLLDNYLSSWIRRCYDGTWGDWCYLTPYVNTVNLESCDTLDKIFNAFYTNYPVRVGSAACPMQGYGYVGGGSSNNLQTLIGNPNIGTYVVATFRMVNNWTIEVFATNYTSSSRYNLKRKYIWHNASYMQSAWEDVVSV